MFVKPPKVRSLHHHIYLKDPIGIPLPTAHNTLESDHNGVHNFSCRIYKTLANVGKQGQAIRSNTCLTLRVVLVAVIIANATRCLRIDWPIASYH
jgi:hypothetical protein